MKETLNKNTPYMNLALWTAMVILILCVAVPALHSNQERFKPNRNIHVQTEYVYPPPLPEKLVASQKIAPEKPEPEPAVNLAFSLEAERRYHPYIIKASNRYAVDPAMVHAIIMAESSYDPKAVSKAGARGLMQLMPGTAVEMGVQDSFNPEHNIEGGVRYYKKLLVQFKGNTQLALAAYNAGSRYVRHYKGIPPFKATRYYVKKVMEYYRYYKKQMVMKKA